jgi:TatA/E family protein of Tat protein translocase
MGGFSLAHWVIILILVMLFGGANRLPQLGKSLGEAIRGFKKGLEGDEIDVTKRDSLSSGQQQSQQQVQQQATESKPKPDA